MVSEISVQALTIAKRPSSARTTFLCRASRTRFRPFRHPIGCRIFQSCVIFRADILCHLFPVIRVDWLTPARRSLWIIHHRNHTPAVSPSHSWQNKAENLLHSILQSFLPASSGQNRAAALLFSSASFINAVFLSEILTTVAKALWEDSKPLLLPLLL